LQADALSLSYSVLRAALGHDFIGGLVEDDGLLADRCELELPHRGEGLLLGQVGEGSDTVQLLIPRGDGDHRAFAGNDRVGTLTQLELRRGRDEVELEVTHRRDGPQLAVGRHDREHGAAV
jgi:hypothetical protein